MAVRFSPRWPIFLLICLVSLLAVTALTGCTTLDSVKSDVDSRLTYSYFYSREYPVVASGPTNCGGYAATYQDEASRKGIRGDVKTCLLLDGRGHAFYQAKTGEVLDVRQRGVGTLDDVGCIPGTVRTAAR